jgi:hypothetical protein
VSSQSFSILVNAFTQHPTCVSTYYTIGKTFKEILSVIGGALTTLKVLRGHIEKVSKCL